MRLLFLDNTVETGFIEFLIGQTGTAAIAAIALWQLNRAYTDSLRREHENTQTQRDDKKALIGALQNNAKALTALESACENMGRVRHDG